MHLVYFKPFPSPELGYWESSRFGNLKLEGEIRIQFQGVKACVGYNNGEEQHSCINSALNTKQCPYCSFRDISKVYTRMDLTGFEHLEEEIVNRPYSVYLAYFGSDVIKCGVCREERLLTRLKEQAAIYYINLMRFENANDAYNMERVLQHSFGLRNAVKNSTKLKIMNTLKPECLDSIFKEIKESAPFSDYLVESSKVEKIDYPVPEKFSLSENSIDGEILGSRGSFLLFSNNKDTFAIDMKKKEGEYFRFL